MSAAVVRLPLVESYLREQRSLTAVERFAKQHEERKLPPNTQRYSELIPLSNPGPGQQFAFDVDLDACTGCKACVAACHSMNGLDHQAAETWRSVGLLHGGSPEEPVQQTVTTACHHCLDPACMKGCPVNAYEKDPVTGIVRHLDDQCIGCQYCTLTCPYEVPQFNPERGIVRKCDMCSDRLAIGEAPACVQACPNEAISIRIVDTVRVLEEAQADQFLPGAPSPGITVPTTRYRTKRALPRNLLPADFYSIRSSQQHFPLVVMLVLTQLSVGAFVVDFVLSRRGVDFWEHLPRPLHALVALSLGLLALGASIFHLGRPLYAFRAVIGFKTSWLSREIVAFAVFAKAAVVYAALVWYQSHPSMGAIPGLSTSALAAGVNVFGSVVAATGLVGIACSAMVYGVTHRRWWNFGRSSFRFFATGAILGLATTLLSLVVVAGVNGDLSVAADSVALLSSLLVVSTVCKLCWELGILGHLRSKQLVEFKRTALLLVGRLRSQSLSRLGLGVLGGIGLPLVLQSGLQQVPAMGSVTAVVIAAVAWASLLASELIERALFFRAVSVSRMPGAIGS